MNPMTGETDQTYDEPSADPQPQVTTGTVMCCPQCGWQFRREYVPVGALNDAREEIARLQSLAIRAIRSSNRNREVAMSALREIAGPLK